ncbi:leucine-rich repeat domain-containing protein, partial [Flammeovirga aprica]
SLKSLTLNNSTGAHLPEGLGNLPLLEHLHLRHCKNLFKLPASMGNLRLLWGLDLTGCSRLTGLPSSLTQVPIGILKLSECNNLRSVPKGLNVGSILARDVTWKSMPVGIFDSDANSLNVINHQITDITGIGKMTNLKELDLTNGKIKRIPPGISKCTKLRLLLLEGNEIESTFGV